MVWHGMVWHDIHRPCITPYTNEVISFFSFLSFLSLVLLSIVYTEAWSNQIHTYIDYIRSPWINIRMNGWMDVQYIVHCTYIQQSKVIKVKCSTVHCHYYIAGPYLSLYMYAQYVHYSHEQEWIKWINPSLFPRFVFFEVHLIPVVGSKVNKQNQPYG